MTAHYRIVLIGFLLFAFAQLSMAQSSGIVLVERPDLIEKLQEFRAENGINPAGARMVSLGERDKRGDKRYSTRGFRVQIFSGTGRGDAYAAQERFRKSYPGVSSYVTYSEPNYRVKVGDFRSRSEANSFMEHLRSQYGKVFVFTEDIWVYE